MKKIFSFFVAALMSVSMMGMTVTQTVAPAQPDTAYGVTREEADVMALYCNHYATNNYNFNVLGWGGVELGGTFYGSI